MPSLTDVGYIEWLRRYILVHSYIYYELNQNILEDREYDRVSKELAKLQKTLDFPSSMYYNIFIGFDGTTGFDLFGKLEEKEQEKIKRISLYVLKEYKTNKTKKGGR